MRMLHVQCMTKIFFQFAALVGIVLDLRCMQPHDLIYALHVFSMHLHNNKHAQNCYVHIWDVVTQNSVLVTTQAIEFMLQAHVLPAIVSACALF